MVEAYFLIALLPHRTDFVINESAAKVPLMGWWALAIGAPVAVKGCIQECLKRLEQGRSVGVLAEGHMTHSDQVQELGSILYVLALKSGLPVLPIGLGGNRSYLEARCRYATGGPVGVRVGVPLYLGPEESGPDFCHRIRLELQELVDQAREPVSQWRPDWRFYFLQLFWGVITGIWFWLLDWLKPQHKR